jgi:hypothetical protein
MLSRISKVGLLVGCLVAAGSASAFERSDVVPVIAGAAVGALLATALADDDHDHHHEHHDRYPARPMAYREPQRMPYAHYRPVPQPVRYVPVRQSHERW